jgi:hypothetical protein
MARGWDSKAVEEQQAAAEAEKQTRAKPAMSDAERERQKAREGLLLARARLAGDLQAASDPRYRAMLEQALAHIDGQIDAI